MRWAGDDRGWFIGEKWYNGEVWSMVGLAQMVRASDCGPEGRRFDPDIPPHTMFASVVQRLVCKFSKLEMRFRLPPLAPEKLENPVRGCFFVVGVFDD